MLRNVRNLLGFGIRATDGVIGTVDDVYFDDQDWTIRYFVVNTGSWLTGSRKVLVSAHASVAGLDNARAPRSPYKSPGRAQSGYRHQEACVTAEQNRVSRVSHYWGGSGVWGLDAYPDSLRTESSMEEKVKAHRTPGDPGAGRLPSAQ